MAPDTLATLYVTEAPAQAEPLAEIVPGCESVVEVVTASVRAVLFPQEFTATTDTLPDVVPTVVLIELLVEDPVHPDGNVHMYDVAPLTALTEYVTPTPWHTLVLPVMAPGCEGNVETETVRLRFGPSAQKFMALTETSPDVAPGVTVIDVVDDDPVQPEGNDHE